MFPNQSANRQSGMATGTIQKVTNDSDNGYCKMPDGTLICWGEYRIGSGKATAQVGSMYYADITNVATFPIPFIDTPEVTASQKIDSWGIIGNCVVSTTGISKIAVLRPNSAAIYGVISWIAIGRWK